MIITPYSFVTATIWFSLFILLSEMLRRKIGFSIYCNINILIVFVVLSIARLCVPIELTITQVVDATIIFGFTESLLNPIFTISNFSVNGLFLLVATWIVGIAYSFIILVSKIIRDKKVLKLVVLSKVNNDKVEQYFKSNFQTNNKRCSVVVSSEIYLPMVTGLINPTILLPETISDLPEESWHNILKHEMIHVINKDLWVKFLVELICCVMWFNPVVYLLKSGVDNSLELRCDLHSTRDMNEKEKYHYLSTILFFLKNKSPQRAEPLLSNGFKFLNISENFNIKQRFRLISIPYKETKLKSFGFVLILCVCFVLSYMVVFQPMHYPPPEDLVGTYIFLPENSYILEEPDGTYWIINDEGNKFEVTKRELLSDEMYSTLKVIQND